ncbi:MAG: class IIb bacteriocin, lactobin A/cerein 7B family [Hoeflea sp.]|uniref:class IIb bacteriocin, lactobin A/cerein 7B family n=1 Tax=Hoeflea sp. TaxID=1940281 RepID=UPI00329A6E8E
MTIEAAGEFLSKVTSDDAAMAALGEAISGVSDPKQKCEAISKLGAQNGLEFTAEEAMKVRSAIRAEVAKNSPDAGIELSDEELESVSGGWFLAAVSVLAAGVSVNEATRGKGQTAKDVRWVESNASIGGAVTGGGSPVSDFLGIG